MPTLKATSPVLAESLSRALQRPLVPCGVAITVISALFACGDKKSDPAPGPQPTVPTPSPSPTPPVVPLPIPSPAPNGNAPRAFWVATAAHRLLSLYDATGAQRLIVDLQSYSSAGGVTALQYLDPSTLLAVVDPGGTTGGEFILTVDPGNGTVKQSNWFRDTTNFNNVSTNGLLTGAVSGSVLVHTNTAIERLIFNAVGAGRLTGVSGGNSSYIPAFTTGTCATDKVTNIALLQSNATKVVLMMSAGSAQRLNVVGDLEANPTCHSSHDYAGTGLPTTSADTPAAALQMGDGKVYVLFQHTTNPKIVRYDFDGKTLSAPSIIYQDSAILGSTPRGFAKRTDASFLVGNPIAGKIFEVTTAGSFTGFYLQSSFTIDISAIATSP